MKRIALFAALASNADLRLAAARVEEAEGALREDSEGPINVEQSGATEAELAFVRNRLGRLSFSVDLMKALGGGWQDPGR
jgi:outer membrane protein TolC